LLLAAMGVYAVMAYAVSQRTQEFGIRLALGARPRDVMFGVLRQGLILTGCGMGVGLALAMAGSRLLSSFLFGVNPMDWATFLVVPLVLAAVALLAIWVPARRATRVDPIVALRCE
jgi:ABC-type antimicrobial peptide transport system permease subunit